VNVALAVVAGITVAGAVLAVSSQEARAAVLGILVMLLAAPLIASPWPSPLAVLTRMAAALLAARLLTIGLRGQTAVAGTRIGWPAEALAATAAVAVGFGSHGLGAAGLGPAEAQAAGFGLVALAITPLVNGRDVLRLGLGSILLVLGAILVRVGIDAAPGDGEQLVISLLTVGVGGAVAVIVAAGRAGGGLEISNVPGEHLGPRLPDAHRQIPATPPATEPRKRGRLPRGPSRPDATTPVEP
jgi:hypothetical protein